ncbi:MAG: hypothetical protein ACD_7C00005G0002 [uncultured bacterium]|nr:MAG: hypothetical protein ACD_7C00005G0002 [uncultured bacterium]
MKKNNTKLIALEAIKKKLLGKKLTYKEVFALMDEIANNKMSDILTTYFVAASFKEGFSDEEIYHLTKAMVETGTKLNFSGIVADKHSTGGVSGTRTTMILVPIIAAAGFKIPKTSSRAITSPAGTADCMEVVAPVVFEIKKIQQIVETVGGCIVWGGYLGIAPADDIIIKIEEPLAFESFDKIIVSIMAKKVAVCANHLVLDIPVGKTMKIRHFSDAEKVATKFKMLSKRFNIKIIIDINETLEPSGYGVGPALEVFDVLNILEQKQERSLQLETKALRLAGKLLNACFETAGIKKQGEEEAKKILTNGSALKKFREIIKAQGGNENITVDALKMRGEKYEMKSYQRGKISSINNFNLNTIAKILGAPADKFAGVRLKKKIDHHIVKNEVLCIFYSKDKYRLKEAVETTKNLPIFGIE